MDRETCLQHIVDSGVELLVELRQNQISHKHYPPLIRALTEYREMVRGERKIEREVASTLHYLELEFIAVLNSTRAGKEQRELIGQVHQRFVPIMMDTINPEPESLQSLSEN